MRVYLLDADCRLPSVRQNRQAHGAAGENVRMRYWRSKDALWRIGRVGVAEGKHELVGAFSPEAAFLAWDAAFPLKQVYGAIGSCHWSGVKPLIRTERPLYEGVITTPAFSLLGQSSNGNGALRHLHAKARLLEQESLAGPMGCGSRGCRHKPVQLTVLRCSERGSAKAAHPGKAAS